MILHIRDELYFYCKHDFALQAWKNSGYQRQRCFKQGIITGIYLFFYFIYIRARKARPKITFLACFFLRLLYKKFSLWSWHFAVLSSVSIFCLLPTRYCLLSFPHFNPTSASILATLPKKYHCAFSYIPSMFRIKSLQINTKLIHLERPERSFQELKHENMRGGDKALSV